MNAINWTIDIVFFFVYVDFLKLLAFSILIINVTKIGNKWIKYTIIIIYVAYSIFKITEIREWILYGNLKEFMMILPFFCMLLLPTILKKTKIGEFFLTYDSMVFYYAIVNGVWLYLKPEDGDLVITLIYALIMWLIGRLFEYFAAEGAQK